MDSIYKQYDGGKGLGEDEGEEGVYGKADGDRMYFMYI